MFLIIDETSIHRFNGSKVLIGRAKECDLRLEDVRISPAQCRLTRTSDGTWQLENVGDSQIFLNRVSVPSQQSSRIGSSDRLHIADFSIELREAERGGAVARALRAKMFSLQVELHATVLDIVRNSAGAL